MPEYTFRCTECEHEQDLFYTATEPNKKPPEVCDECGGSKLVRKFGMPFIKPFPGSAMYAAQKGICKKKKPVRGPLHGMPTMKTHSNNP